jgi:hypothetical protein
MIIQWCVKGVGGIAPDDWKEIMERKGLICAWWQQIEPQPFPIGDVPARLTPAHLDRHVNNYSAKDPDTGLRVCERTPFISLAAGSVERHKFLRTNQIHRARRTALRFATQNGRRDGYLFTCYVIVSINPAVPVMGVAEEVRELNSYRRYSPWQLEGEVTAKVLVPPNQIKSCEIWEATRGRPKLRQVGVNSNPLFEDPRSITNVRELF